MKFIWVNDKATVKEVLMHFQQKKPTAYTTIMTVMDNLYRKGFLTRKKIKKSYHYHPVAKEDVIIDQAISRVLRDLISDYGKTKVFFLLIGSYFLTFPRFRPIINVNAIAAPYKAPMGYGLLFTLFSSFLAFSIWDLLQNLQFFGTLEYLKLGLSEPGIILNRLNLFIFAFWESLPIVNLSTTIVSLGVVVILLKKLSRLVYE